MTNLTIEGEGLSGVAARVMRDGQSLSSVAVSAQDSSDSQAHLALAVAPNAPLGPAQLVFSKSSYADVAVDIRVIEPGEFALEADTVGLWHLDERDEGATHLLDASDHAINLTTVQASRVAEGRFGGGRSLARATAETNSDALLFGTSSFTVESWVKTEALDRDYVLVGKETSSGQNTDFTLKALSSGALRAELYDTNGLTWQAETLDSVADGKWHAVALVVDREAGSLSLYIDGQLTAGNPMPTGFAGLRNLGQPLEFGCFDADGPSGTGREEFPGILDETRISSTAHRPEKIAADFFGHDEPQITRIRPAVLRQGTGPVAVTISGYGLAGARVTANQPGVTVVVVSSTPTGLELSLVLSNSVAPGPIQLSITDALGRTTVAELGVVERTTGGRNTNPRRGGTSPDANAREGSNRRAPAALRRRPPDLTPVENRTKSQTGASFRSAKSSVGGQR
jgi:hypothetical protein